MPQTPGGIAAFVLVATPEEVVLVCEPAKARPGEQPLWKIPGGAGHPGEDPPRTAIRECEEETGIRVEATELVTITREPLPTHTKFFFRVQRDSLAPIARERTGEEGEKLLVMAFARDQLPAMMHQGLILRPHIHILQRAGRL